MKKIAKERLDLSKYYGSVISIVVESCTVLSLHKAQLKFLIFFTFTPEADSGLCTIMKRN